MSIDTFEVLTVDGNRFRFNKANYRWQYALQEGSIDLLDKTVVEVICDEDEHEPYEVAIFSQVIAVGNVDENTCLQMPREKLLRQCPRCGFTEVKQ